MSSRRILTTEKAPKGLSLDKQYYIPGGDLHFKVERTLFRVHSYFFSRESPQYRERMAGVDHAKTNDGRSDKAAILVGNTTVEDFSKFLWIFYNPDYTFDSTPASVWCTILELSSPLKWDFPKMHALALRQLADLQIPLVDRIVLYRKCSITIDRLLPLYADLCLREEPLTLEESVRLGYEFSVPISQVRERVLRRRGKAIYDINQSLGMASTPDDLEISKEQVIELVMSALKTTEALSSIRDLQKPSECLTAQQDVHDQFQSQVKSSMRASSSKHATMINLDGQATTTESTNQNNSRSALSSSKGKAPAVGRAQRIFKCTVAQIRIKNSSDNNDTPDAAKAARVRVRT
ncbi:hypothetical protein Agabi119p4_2214 [Agaricus bisporus var. burnettii]|uniref:BTB domain-containing protein n=1 Tax=Agaricus bisporus var. burnettii TaxID=192524 RepID=A0A8H7KK17_AGABI|nr:hypothetical protein Agabi119p4_2214 [Agaricus bisporus var. burnettii]